MLRCTYNKGKTLFLSLLKAHHDYLSSSLLEAAYAWTLSTKSAIDKGLVFEELDFNINCNELQPARLFSAVDSSICNTASLKQGVLYYADQRNGKATHPLADIFFITKEQELVLVDVTGGDDKKRIQKGDWWHGLKLTVDSAGVVLAPNDICGKHSFTTRVPNTNGRSAVEVVKGADARRIWTKSLCGWRSNRGWDACRGDCNPDRRMLRY